MSVRGPRVRICFYADTGIATVERRKRACPFNSVFVGLPFLYCVLVLLEISLFSVGSLHTFHFVIAK